ncbi:morphogenic membrane protein MmpA [Streptomyces atroolivaceus]|uniref:Morphogenic membrane protein MmpA n=1 Tax=Streptomyces atroolivaceus TaxID=66869 RepID=A0ABV9V8N2_STRAZ
MIDHHAPRMSTGTVRLSQRGVAVGMTLGVLAGTAWTVSMVVTLASWML